MNKSARIFMSFLVPAFLLAGVAAIPAMAQEKAKPAAAQDKAKSPDKIDQKVLFENDKVRVVESRFPPGSVGPSTARPARVAHTVKGGTFLRTYPDGKKVKVETKTGETRWMEAETYEFTNAGNAEIVLHTVYLK
jgi:hypothetical protein